MHGYSPRHRRNSSWSSAKAGCPSEMVNFITRSATSIKDERNNLETHDQDDTK